MDLKKYPGSSELAARISSYELAYRMQGCAPEAVDVNRESEATRKLYGMDEKITEPFGRQCLMARRLVERGVRFVQLYHGGLGKQNSDTWDAHDDVKENHTRHAAEVDRPIAGLLTDLKARGLLDSTLVIWHGEFGRMPISQKGVGRDHNPGAMTMWMAGAGIKGGQIIGVERRVRLQGGAAADRGPRPARHHAAPAGHRPHQAHLSLQRPEHAADRCLRRVHSTVGYVGKLRASREQLPSPDALSGCGIRRWQSDVDGA